ncbi:MAG TPA: S-layer homology domain-containing protein [Thermoanaerobacterales bacterium]|jgi:hypothetical protein|nr:S-layer homology domain-containing protein [Thermoanaerobacterales bacterium]
MFKKKVTIIMATLLLALLVFPIAFAAEVTFELSTDIAWPEDSVKVSGTADPETWVSIKVIDNDSEIVFFDATKSDADGNYSLTFKVPFVKPGTLTVVAGYKAKVATGKLIVPGALTDIGGHWAEADIIALVEKRAITGYPDQTFKPNNNITRAEFAAVLVKAFQLEAKEGKIFTDTAAHWAKDVIATAAAHGIVDGYSDTIFSPNDNITREQMAVMVTRAANLIDEVQAPIFSDSAKISAWAKDAVAVAANAEIIKGYPDGSFRPQGQATRAEAVTVVVKALK